MLQHNTAGWALKHNLLPYSPEEGGAMPDDGERPPLQFGMKGLLGIVTQTAFGAQVVFNV